VGALEPQFRAELMARLGLSGEDPDLKATLAATFRQHPRDHWCALLEGSDSCFAPVLSLAEAPDHPHNAFRGSFATIGAVTQPAPAPRYSATPNSAPQAPRPDADALLAELGYEPARIAALRAAGTIG